VKNDVFTIFYPDQCRLIFLLGGGIFEESLSKISTNDVPKGHMWKTIENRMIKPLPFWDDLYNP
jgi:hypothetical protein